VALDIELPTLGKVLAALSDKSGFPIYSPKSGEITGDFKVYLNGVEHDGIIAGDTPLKREDAVEVTLVILSGG
jgi:hypothetical protein